MNTDGDSRERESLGNLIISVWDSQSTTPVQSSLEFTNPDQDISTLTTHNTFQNFCYEYIILSPLRWIIVTKKRLVLYTNSSKFSMRCCCWVHNNHSRKTTKCNVETRVCCAFWLILRQSKRLNNSESITQRPRIPQDLYKPSYYTMTLQPNNR